MKNLLSKVDLLYIESSKYDVDWHSTLHSHPFTEFFYVVSGEGQFKFSDETFVSVKADDMVIINPNVVHTEVSSKTDPLEYIVLGLNGVMFLAGQENDMGYSVHNYKDYKHDILLYLKSILIEYNNQDLHHELIMKNLINVLVLNVVRRTAVDLQLFELDKKLNKDCIFIENYLNIHFRENITLDDLADLTFLNKYYLSHIFKEHSGLSPIDYILHKRVEEAKKLLSNTDLNISQIASILGFGTASYFSQYFKKETTFSPSEYRKAYGQVKK